MWWEKPVVFGFMSFLATITVWASMIIANAVGNGFEWWEFFTWYNTASMIAGGIFAGMIVFNLTAIIIWSLKN